MYLKLSTLRIIPVIVSACRRKRKKWEWITPNIFTLRHYVNKIEWNGRMKERKMGGRELPTRVGFIKGELLGAEKSKLYLLSLKVRSGAEWRMERRLFDEMEWDCDRNVGAFVLLREKLIFASFAFAHLLKALNYLSVEWDMEMKKSEKGWEVWNFFASEFELLFSFFAFLDSFLLPNSFYCWKFSRKMKRNPE